MTNVKVIQVLSDNLPDHIAQKFPPGILLLGNAHPDIGTVLYSSDRKYSIAETDDLSPYAFSCKESDAEYVSNAEIATRIADQFSSDASEHEKVSQQALAYLMRQRSAAEELSSCNSGSIYQHYIDIWQERYAQATQNVANLINRLASANARSQSNQRSPRITHITESR